MATPDEQKTGNEGAPTELGVRAVAPRSDQVIDVLARYLVVVVVRDRTGSPIADASVTVVVDDTPQPIRTTDAMGLVEPPFVVLPQRQIVVKAEFPPLPKTPVTPGSFRMDPAEVTLPLAALEERGKPPAGAGLEPAWPDLGEVKKVLFLTLQPRCTYRMKHHFPWQNPVLREQIYRKDPQEHNDPGQSAQTGELAVEKDKDRKQRLRDFISYYAGRVPGAQSPSDYFRERGVKGRSTPELDQIARSQADEDILFAHLSRIERRIEWLMIYAYPRKGGAPPDPALEPPDLDGIEGRHPREEPEGVVDTSMDVGAGQRRQDFGDDPPAYFDPTWKDIDTSSPRKEVESLKARRKQILARAKKMEASAAKIADAELRALTHRELVEYIVSEIFGKDPDRELFPAWVRYAVLHFSGLRYAGASGSYYPAEELLRTFREEEMLQERSAPLDRHKLAIFLEEHASLLLADSGLQNGIFSRADRAASTKNKALPVTSVAGKLFAACATMRGEAKGKAVLDEGAMRQALDTAQEKFVKHWIKSLNDVGLRRASRSPASGDKAPPDNPLTDVWGLIVRARETGRLPPDAWPAIVQYTELRNDFVNVRAVAFRPPPKKKNKDDPDPVLPPPPPPVDGSPWPVLCPSLEGSIIKDYGAKLPGLFRDGLWDRWKPQHAGDLSLVVSRAVCNQITEMLGAARNLKLGGGIPANAAAVDSGDEQLDLILPVDSKEFDSDAAEEEGRELLLNAARLIGIVNHFTLGSSPARVKRGDFMFFLEWRPIGTPDKWGWASPFLNIPYFLLAVRSPDEPRPRTEKELEADEADHQKRLREWKAREAEWKKKVDAAAAARKKAERIAREEARRANPKAKFTPAKPPPGGYFPGEEPFPEPKPERPRPPPGSVLQVHRHSKSPPVFTANGHPIPVIESWTDPRIKRGTIPRPRTPVPFDTPSSLPSSLTTPASQLALLRTPLGDGHPLAYVFVRRHPRTDVYTEVLGWQHVATIIEPPGERGRLITFETNAPTGVNARGFGEWSQLFGHMVAQDESLPYLEGYLDPDLLLDKNALPDEEDR